MASNRIFVVGTGVVGEPLISDASSRGNKVTVLEEDLRKAEKLARLKGVRSIHIPEFSLDELRKAGVPDADLVLATSDNDEQNMRIITYSLELGCPRVGALASDEEHRDIFQRLGAHTVVVPARIVSEHLRQLFLSTSIMYDFVLNDGSRILQINVNKDSPLCGRSPADQDALAKGQWIIAVIRGEEHFHPAAIDVIEAGDLVTLYVVPQPSMNSSLLAMLE